MAKVPNGILGNLSGKVSGVVGGTWRGVGYIRAYTKPGYSNTDAQALQRSKMAYIVEAGKPFVGRIFNAYVDKFVSGMSAFNKFIKDNIQGAGALADVTALVISDGPLYPGSDLSYTGPVGDVLTVNWGVELGVDGADTDVAIAYWRDPISNRVAFSANSTRSAGTAGVTITDTVLSALSDYEVGVMFARVTNSVVNRISRNLTAYENG